MGPLRLTVYPLVRMAFLRRYSGTLRCLDAKTDEWIVVDATECASPLCHPLCHPRPAPAAGSRARPARARVQLGWPVGV